MSKQQFEEEYWSGHEQRLEERHKLAMQLIGQPESILDLGCGDGFFLSQVNVKRKVGLEMSTQAVNAAKKKRLDVRVFDFETKKLPFKQNEFDVVTLLDVLEHTFDPRKPLNIAAQAGKRIVITVPNFAFFVSRLQALSGGVPTILGERKGHIFYFTRKKLHQVFRDSGIRIVREKYYFPMMHVPIIGEISRLIGSIFPGFFATEFAIMGEKL